MTSLPSRADRPPRPRVAVSLNLIPLFLLALALQVNLISSFRPSLVSISTRNARHPSLPLHRRVTRLASTSENTGSSSAPLPFFAAPASFNASPPSSSSTPQSSTVTLRLPLGTLFDGRDYIFVTYTNVRGYEWGVKEVNVLVEDLMDAALGSLGGELREAGAGSSNPSPMQQQTLTADFELSQIVLVPTSDWDATSLGLGNRYDVYDGQQRLVTLNLLLAALRDSFQSEADSTVGGGKRAVALAATAKEISSMLKPTKVRKEDVLRITLRKRDNVLLEKILSPQNESTDEEKEEQAISMGTAGETPTAYLSKLTPKERNELLSPLSLANARIFENFLHISDRLSLLSTRERLRMLDYIVERVHLLVCIPETSRIARNIVMSQGRKGMDNEAIDDFKGLVCFRYTLEEKDMYQTFDRWDALAAEPTIGAIGETLQSSEQTTTPVGRDIIAAACLLRSSAALRTKIRGGGADEVYEWERWLRHVLWLQNQRLAEEQKTTDGGPIQTSWQGKDFFSKEIEPASLALYHFRTGNWDEFNFLAVKSKKADEQSRNIRVRVQLNFLRDMIASAGSAKEAEILALELLLRAQEHAAAGDDALLFRYLDEFLPLIERWSLWMALSRPSPMQRHARVFAILDAMEHNDSMGSVGHSSGYDDMETLKECMNNYKFGATASGKRLAVAILNRMNAYLMMKDGKEIPLDQESAVDAILPEKIPKGSDWDQNWTEEHHEEWIHCLGNLASISKTGARGGRRGGNKGVNSTSWEAKVNIYKKETWPLTRELTDLDVWNVDAIIDRQKLLVSLLELIWKK